MNTKREYAANIATTQDALSKRVSRASRISLLVALGLITTALGIIFAELVVPPIIATAYRGESFSFLNGMIRGQTVHPVAFYLQLWNNIALRVLVTIFGFWLFALALSSEA